MRGNTWIILDLVMALFGTLGWVDPGAPQLRVEDRRGHRHHGAYRWPSAWFGYKAIAAFEKWTVPPTIIILAVMSAVAWFGMKIDWGYAGPAGQILEGSERIAAMSAVMTAIGIGWGITWFTYAADYSRFVSTESPQEEGLPGVASWASSSPWCGSESSAPASPPTGVRIDPGKLIVQNFGVMALPVLLMVLHGPIATNILNIYTFSVATQALDITISRRKLNLFVGVFSLAAVVFFIFQEDFAAVLDAWLIGLVAWVAAWGGVMLVHYFWLDKRWPGNPERLSTQWAPSGTRWSTGPGGLAPGRHLRHVAVYVRTRSRHAGPPRSGPGRLGPLLARRRPGQCRQLRLLGPVYHRRHLDSALPAEPLPRPPPT